MFLIWWSIWVEEKRKKAKVEYPRAYMLSRSPLSHTKVCCNPTNHKQRMGGGKANKLARNPKRGEKISKSGVSHGFWRNEVRERWILDDSTFRASRVVTGIQSMREAAMRWTWNQCQRFYTVMKTAEARGKTWTLEFWDTNSRYFLEMIFPFPNNLNWLCSIFFTINTHNIQNAIKSLTCQKQLPILKEIQWLYKK